MEYAISAAAWSTSTLNEIRIELLRLHRSNLETKGAVKLLQKDLNFIILTKALAILGNRPRP
jgi:hypothetical protein